MRGTPKLGLIFFGFVLLALATVLFGIIATVAGLRLAFRSKSDRRRAWIAGATAPLALLCVVGLALPAIWAGDAATDWFRLFYNRSAYERIIADEQSSSDNRDHLTANGIEYRVDRGPPIRIAFHPDGFLDNWSGIVFDPTRRVASAQGWGKFAGDYAVDPDLKSLFGGDLVSCTHMKGDYFRCSFT